MTLRWSHLVGRTYEQGRADCLALVRDFYLDNFGIQIADYARPTDWSADQLDLIRLLHEREQFELIANWRAQDLRPGDLLCMCVAASNADHFAVYVGDNTMVHHLYNRLSSEEPYRDFWRNLTGYLLRHRLVPDLRPTHPDIDLRTMLSERYAVTSESVDS